MSLQNNNNINIKTNRTCFLTGRVGEADSFLRFVNIDGILLPDISGCLPLKGYWCLIDRKFFLDIRNNKIFCKAFDGKIKITNDFEMRIQSVLYKNARETIGLIKKTGSICFGYEKVYSKMLNNKIYKVIVAIDASKKIREKMEILALKKGIKVLRILYKVEIEKLIELYNCVYMGFEKDDKLSNKLISYLYLLKSLRKDNILLEAEQAL